MTKRNGMLLNGVAFLIIAACSVLAFMMNMFPWSIFIAGVAVFFLLEFFSYAAMTDK